MGSVIIIILGLAALWAGAIFYICWTTPTEEILKHYRDDQ